MADRVLELVHRAGRRRHRLAAVGVVEGAPVTWAGEPTDPFQIGSVTKVFTSLLLATYVVDGSLDLEQPVRELVPDLTGPVATASLGRLATHTAGLPRIPRELWPRALGRHPDPYADLDHGALLRTLATTRARPSRRPRYSNLGAGLLGHALATWAGTDYDTLVRDRVAAPLGLSATSCLPGEQPPGHRRRGTARAAVWHFDALAGAGALWSTPADLQRFLGAQLEPPPGRLGEAIRLTHEVRVPGRLDQCLGWVRLSGRGRALLWHNGGTAGYRSFVGVQPDDRTGVAVLADDDRSVDGLALGILKELAGPGRQPSATGA